MKKIHSVLIFPIIYSLFMLYRTPSISDALIVLGLLAASVFLVMFTYKYNFYVNPQKSELNKLEEELQLERLKLSIEQVKENALREKMIRDSRAALNDGAQNREIRF